MAAENYRTLNNAAELLHPNYNRGTFKMNYTAVILKFNNYINNFSRKQCI